MNKKYEVYAEIMVALHFLWFVIGVISLPLIFLVPGYDIFALVFVGGTTVAIGLWKGCPLRIWEKSFRQKYDPSTVYDGVFMQHYLKKFFNIDISRRTVRIIITSYLTLLFVLASII